MKPKTRIFAVGGALLTLGLFLWARELASWRPKLVGATRTTADLSNIAITRSSAELIKISPDGRLGFAGNGYHFEPTKIWDLENHGFFEDKRTERGAIIFSSDSQRAFLTSEDLGFSEGSLFSMGAGKKFRSIKFDHKFLGTLPALSFSDDEREILFFGDSRFWRGDWNTGKMRAQFEVATGQEISQYLISADTKQLMARDSQGLHFYDSKSGEKLGFIGGKDFIEAGWSPDGKIVWAWQPSAANFLSWNGRQSQLLRTSVVNSPLEIHFTPDSKFLAVATPKGLEMREVSTGKLVKTLLGPREEPFDISKNGDFAISVDKRGKIWRWRLK